MMVPSQIQRTSFANRSRGGRCSKGKRRGQAHFSDLTFVEPRTRIGGKMSQTPLP